MVKLVVGIKLEDTLINEIDQFVKAKGEPYNRSDVIREAIQEYLAKNKGAKQ